MAFIPGLIGAGLSFFGSRSQQRAQENAAQSASTTLDNFRSLGLGGAGGRILQSGPGVNEIELFGGDLEFPRQGLVNLANSSIFNAGRPNVSGPVQALSGIPGIGQTLNPSLGSATGLLTGANIAGGASLAEFLNRSSQGSSGDQARASTLANLRAQARPGQDRAVSSALTSLFNTGRLGSTGGANVIGRLAEAQNQQDLGFQLAAGAEGRAVTGLQENLLNSAFGRFAQTSQLANDLNRSRFGIASAGREFGQQDFANSLALAQLPGQLQSQQLQLALQALGGQQGINSQVLENFGAGLSTSQAAANARIGSGSNIARIAQNPNFGLSPLDALGGAISNNSEAIGNVLGRVFRTSSNPGINSSAAGP